MIAQLPLSPLRRMRPLLGTYVEIAAAGDPTKSEAAISAAFARIQQIHTLLSFQNPDSELSRLNNNPLRWILLSPWSLRVLKLARAMTIASNHRFNCTLGGALIEKGVLPNHGGCYEPQGSAQDIDISHNRARLLKPLRITLDGIAKGFAVDLAIAELKKYSLNYAWVNAGGDLRIVGDSTLPITQYGHDGCYRPLGGIRNAAMATSQIRNHVDPDRPGWIVATSPTRLATQQAHNRISQVFSVVAHYAWRADALTKVAANTPEKYRAAEIRRLRGLLVEENALCAV